MSNNKKISGLLPLAPRTLDEVTGFATYIDTEDQGSINVKVSGQEIIDGIYKISSSSLINDVRYSSSAQAYSGGTKESYKIEFKTYSTDACWTIDSSGDLLPMVSPDEEYIHNIGNIENKLGVLYVGQTNFIKIGADDDTQPENLTVISLLNDIQENDDSTSSRPYLTFRRESDSTYSSIFEGSIMTVLKSKMSGASFEKGILTLPEFPEPPEPLVYTGEDPIVVDKTTISFSGLVLTDKERDNIKTNSDKVSFPGFGTDSNLALDGSYAEAINANTDKVGITTQQAEDIATNNEKVSANNATVEIKTGQGLEGGDSFNLNQPGDKEITISLTTPINDGKLKLTAGEGITFSGDSTFSANQSGDTELTISSKPSNTGVVIDLEGIKGSEKKADLNKKEQETIGVAGNYTVKGEIENGQVVVFDYTDGDLKVQSPTGQPTKLQTAGVALSKASDGEKATILKQGFATLRKDTEFMELEESINMTINPDVQSDAIPLANLTKFYDPGGPDSNYPSPMPEKHTSFTVFDLGAQKTKEGAHIIFQVKNFSFEGGSTYRKILYDSLVCQVADEQNGPWYNVSYSWMQTLKYPDAPFNNDSSSPYVSYLINESDGSRLSGLGSQFPANLSKANENAEEFRDWNGDTLKDITGVDFHVTGTPIRQTSSSPDSRATMGNPNDPKTWRYIRFYFTSDVFGNASGWEIHLRPSTPYTTQVKPVPVGAALFINPESPTKVVTENTTGSGVQVGVCAYNNPSNNAIFARVLNLQA